MKKWPGFVVLGLLLAAMSGGAAFAGVLTDRPCIRGVEPAATLLFPYFEVELDNPNGLTTLMAITNVLLEPVVVKVIVWSDWAVPVGFFHLYLTGLDVQTLNLRDVLEGRLPGTGSEVSPVGGESLPNQDFPGCDPQGVLGEGFDPGFVRGALTHQEIEGGCWSSGTVPPDRAVGFVTVDVVNQCSSLLPADKGYFERGGTGVASNKNALLGDYFLVDPQQNLAQGEPAVHLVADPDFFSPGDETFYGPYVGFDARDARVPLSSRHAIRFVVGGGFSGGTNLIVWRQVLEPAEPPSDCRVGNTGWLSPSATLFMFDEEENGGEVFPQTNDTARFFLATQKPSLQDLVPPVIPFGWFVVDFRDRQGWVSGLLSAFDRFSVGYSGARLDDLCTKGGGP